MYLQKYTHLSSLYILTQLVKIDRNQAFCATLVIFLLQTNSIQHQQMVAFFILYERLMNNQQMLLTVTMQITVTMQGAPYAWAISHLAKSCYGSKVGYHPLARCKSCHAVNNSRCALRDSCCVDATYVTREAQKIVL